MPDKQQDIHSKSPAPGVQISMNLNDGDQSVSVSVPSDLGGQPDQGLLGTAVPPSSGPVGPE